MAMVESFSHVVALRTPATGSCCSTPASARSGRGSCRRLRGVAHRAGPHASSTPTATSTTSAARGAFWTTPTSAGTGEPAVVGHENVPDALRPLRPDRRLQRASSTSASSAASGLTGLAATDAAAFPPALGRARPRPTATALQLERRRPRPSSCTTPGRDRRPHLGVDPRAPGGRAPATSSSGSSPTPATRRRCSATRSSGPRPLREMAALRTRAAAAGPRPADRGARRASSTVLDDVAAALEALVARDARRS